jgi:hypothetical protein
VFDAYAWCPSDLLEWRGPAPGLALDAPLAREDGATWLGRMVFVLYTPCDFLPQELARLHALGLGLEDERALAPYAIDAATDELYARKVRPRDLFWLAADGINALFWGLHDWAHFHNHGLFEQRAWTELQCDGAALAWLGRNRATIGLAPARLARLEEEVLALCRARFAEEGLAWDRGPRQAFETLARSTKRITGRREGGKIS